MRNRVILSMLVALVTAIGLVVANTASGQDQTSQPLLANPFDDRLIENAFTEIDPEAPVPRFRKSFYQGAELRGGYMLDLGGGADAVNQTFEEARIAFGVPLLSLQNILGVSPYVRIDHLDGPEQTDFTAPETLYNVGISMINLKEWSPRVSTLVLVTPSIRSDMTTSENAFRMFGLGLINWKCSEELTLAFGAVYLGRADLGVLPAVGVTWTPTPFWKFDLMLPRPRISHRFWKQASDAEAWGYLGIELGGNSYAVTRDSGMRDQLNVKGIDLVAGYEVLRAGNRGYLIESGFTFGRELEYENTGESLDLDNAVFVRAGWRF